MLQTGGDVDLGKKSFSTQHSSELWMDDLDSDLAMMTKIFREIDGRHAALSQLSFNCVFVGQRDRETIQRVSHFCASRAIRALISSSQFSTTMARVSSLEDWSIMNCPEGETSYAARLFEVQKVSLNSAVLESTVN